MREVQRIPEEVAQRQGGEVMSSLKEALNDVNGSIRNAEEILEQTRKKKNRARSLDEKRYYRGKLNGMNEVLGGLRLALWHIEHLDKEHRDV